jgi:hypothetical protein
MINFEVYQVIVGSFAILRGHTRRRLDSASYWKHWKSAGAIFTSKKVRGVGFEPTDP